MTNFKNPNPDCERDDCKFTKSGGMSTLAYYPPMYNKDGVNINPDRNITYFSVSCKTCGKQWSGQSQLGETIYEVL